MPRRLPPGFYRRPTLKVAEDLIGRVLVHTTREGTTVGRIVEVEAYIGETDPACHAAPGWTPRNAPLYGPPGRAYVYLNYGIHQLVNVVTEPEGVPAAILLRAAEPLEGLDLMRRRRDRRGSGRALVRMELCRGPGNLTKAMGITLAQNRSALDGSDFYLGDSPATRGKDPGTCDPTLAVVDWSPRIGIRMATGRRWRCALAGSPYVSGPRAHPKSTIRPLRATSAVQTPRR